MTGNFTLLKLNCLVTYSSTFLIFAGFLFTGFKYLAECYLKHLLSSYLRFDYYSDV